MPQRHQWCEGPMKISAYALGAAALLVLGSAVPALAQKGGGGGYGGGGGGINASFPGNCPGEYRYVYLCLGVNGSRGVRTYIIPPGGRRAILTPPGSSYNASCGAWPRRGCPGSFTVVRE
jgi:hypothetical protein